MSSPSPASRKRGSPWSGWLAALGLFAAVFSLFVAWTRYDLAPFPSPHSPEEIKAAEAKREAAFTQTPPPVVNLAIPQSEYDRAAEWRAAHPEVVHRRDAVEAAVREGALPSWFPRGESAITARLHGEGDLPPVADRVGSEPVVMRGVDGVGRHGGVWMRVASSIEDVNIVSSRLGNITFLRYSPYGDPLVPHLAKGVESLDGGRSYVIHFRRGVRWSDGHPLTSNDLMFWWDHFVHEPLLSGERPAIPDHWSVGGKPPKITRVDDHAVRIDFAEPYPLFPYNLARYAAPVHPAHYLGPRHPALGEKEFVDAEMRRWGVVSPRALYAMVTSWKNPELPRLSPWILRRPVSTPPLVYERNPYYFAVDTDGNQLPYIDRVQASVLDAKMIPLALASGAATMQMRHLRFGNYTEVMTRSESAGQRVLHWYPAIRSEWMINPNLNRLVREGDATTRWKARLLSDKRFRQALSTAINRRAVTESVWLGVVKPAQLAPGWQSEYHHPGLQDAYIAYDPDGANRLLDALWREAGADPSARDSDGCRLAPDGSRLTFYLDYSDMTGDGPAAFVIDDWLAVGVRCVPRSRTRSLFYLEKTTLDFDFNVWWGESVHDPLLNPRHFMATDSETFFAGGWGRWRQRGGLYGDPRATLSSNAVPVPENSDMRRAIELHEAARAAPTRAEAREYVSRFLDIAAENVWTIGLAEAPAQLVVVDKDLRGVPENAIHGYQYFSPTNTGPETYYFEHPRTTPGAIAEAVEALRAMPSFSASASGDAASGRKGNAAGAGGLPARGLIVWALWGTAGALLALLCLRHPFVLRRLALMVPTLLVVSICVFVIIQLPPGDFLSTKIVELEQAGSDPEMIESQIEDLKTLFHYDDPQWKRYLRWVGVYWFGSFSEADEGLLQGNLGRSMETQQPVNRMVGDTIWLTVAVSVATIIFTWLVALPIGIYSAVRQYTWSDYCITVAGFLGMCIPNFLLALVLTVWANVTGLFSPAFAAQPEWDWPKTLDLLKHIWIPILVLGASGTAGMIRIMRANLLDELRRPYVVTARAKGMRPMALLLKYPVRLALNPFVSGIGGLFPQLVSGGAIVAMVLSLPLVGPLMLNALSAQDMNFAGSMLMVMSALGVFGTLVSDLLLLWVDPRIRFEGGGK